VGTVRARDALVALVRHHHIDAVLHCAARSLVGESMREPALYYAENVVGGLTLLDAMREAGVDRLVFSSTAAVYGRPEQIPVVEDAPTRPVNTYGASKLAFEGAMHWYAAYGLRSVSLRYFNVAGASERYGERHTPESHLIPNVLAALRGGPELTVFGDDYATPDGTAVRDYIHVLDLADAHMDALDLTATMAPGEEVCNLGSGSGFSVREVLVAAEQIVGRPVPHRFGPRREGDPPVLVASNARALALLGWTPEQGTLAEMIGSAWHLGGRRDALSERA
jgi:UDP-glucose 4-epimerase